MARAERIGSGLLLAFGLFTIYQAYRLPLRSLLVGIGPGFLPLWLGVGLVLVSAFRLVSSLSGNGRAPAGAPPGREEKLVQDDSGTIADALPVDTATPRREEDRVVSGEGSRIEVESAAPEQPGGWPRVLITLVLIAGYAVLLEPVGYIGATLLLLAALLLLLRQSPAVIAAMAIIGAVGTYALFHTWLGVPLPRGLFGF